MRAFLSLTATALLLSACSSPAPQAESIASPSHSASPAPSARTDPTPSLPPTPTPAPRRETHPPRDALLTIPALDIRNLRVVAYRGKTDDAAGTRIQNRGHAASPHGPRGGAGPGGIGNYQVTAHRLSSTRAFLDLPDLDRGDRVHVTAAGTRWTYEIVATRKTSFRSARSLAEQRAAVPGHPGRTPARAFLTLSTCATPEDHAQGNYWSDAFDNPEHRIDKIGVLVRTDPT
ncbi:sortase domain-containing protein [Mumia quercus]|uniref:sortase domain-containing protein n=1 Tax=Mumia quercus TaxID=2976125 RepID=UPI0021D053B5|nr:sortase [Mumia quercus]